MADTEDFLKDRRLLCVEDTVGNSPEVETEILHRKFQSKHTKIFTQFSKISKPNQNVLNVFDQAESHLVTK
jgi:hypothetical protein